MKISSFPVSVFYNSRTGCLVELVWSFGAPSSSHNKDLVELSSGLVFSVIKFLDTYNGNRLSYLRDTLVCSRCFKNSYNTVVFVKGEPPVLCLSHTSFFSENLRVLKYPSNYFYESG